MLRRLLSALVFSLTLGGLLVAQEASSDPLTVGKSLPGTFHPFNINVAAPPAQETLPDKDLKTTYRPVPYSTRHKYHCLISEYDLDPTILLFVRGLEAPEGLKSLLQKVDAAIERNRRIVRLRAFVVFLPDDLKNLTEEDDKREAAARTLDRLVEDLKLKHVVVTLAARPDVARYRLDDANALTAVLYSKLKIVAVHKLPANKLETEDAAIKAILDDITAKLGAKN